MTRLRLSRAALAWLLARSVLALAAILAALLAGRPLVALALAAAIVLIRPLRRGWLAVIPILIAAPFAPAAAILLASRALFSEAFLLLAGRDGGPGTPAGGLRARRARGLKAIQHQRQAALEITKTPVAPSLAEADALLAAARAGAEPLDDAAVRVAATAVAEARPWILVRRMPELIVATFTAVFEDGSESERGGTIPSDLGKGLLIEMAGPPLFKSLVVLAAVLTAAIAFPASPVSLGPITLPGWFAQGLAVLLLGSAVAARSPLSLILATGVTYLLVGSQIVETALIVAMAGVLIALAQARLERFLVSGQALRRGPREPYRGPRRLRGLWQAATDAAEQGRLPIAIELLEEILSAPACTEQLRDQARARLALNLLEVGDLERAGSTWAEIEDSDLPPQALPAAGAAAAGLGDLESAETLLQKALASLPRRSPLRQRAGLSLAETYSRRGQPEQAIALLRELGDDTWTYRGMTRMLDGEVQVAAALARQGDLEQAAQRLASNVQVSTFDLIEIGGLSKDLSRELAHSEGRARLISGEIALARNRIADAVEALETALEHLEEDRDPHLYARARALHGVAMTLRHASEEGLRELDIGVRTLEARRTQLHRADHRAGLLLAETDLYSWCFRAFERAAELGMEEAAESAAWLIESLRKSALAEMLRGEGAELPAPARQLTERIAELERTVASHSDPIDADNEAEIKRAREDLADALSDQFAAAYVPAPSSVDSLRELARDFGDVLSFYLPGGVLPGWRVWIRRDGELEVERIEIEDPAASALLAELASSDAAGATALHAPIDSEAATVWTTLAAALLPPGLATTFRPLGEEEWAPPLLIAPDGVLGLLPWAALPLDGTPLGTRAAIQIVPSLGVVDAGAGQQAVAVAGGPALAYLDPALEGVDSERRLLEDNFELTLAESGEGFLDRLREQRHQGAYIAAHGDGMGLGQSVGLGDGRLSAGAALRSPWPSWTVFASCLVGRVPLQTGQEPLGLPISCVLAGSHSVLAAMAEVPSATLPAFAEPLLRALAAGEHPAQALASAQRAYLEANPYASVAECLSFVCLTRSPEPRTMAERELRSMSWQEIAKAAEAEAESDPKRARAIYEIGIEVDPEPELIVRYVYFLAGPGDDLEEAEKILVQSISRRPEDLELREAHAWFLYRHGDDHGATRAALERVLDLDPRNEWAVPEFARFLRVHTHEYARAANYYRRALEANPDDPAYASALGDMLERCEDLAAAREMYERALAQESGRAGTSSLLASLLGRSEKKGERMARLYERAIRLAPKYAGAYLNRWALIAAHDLDDHDLARQLCERGHAAAPEDPNLTVNLAWLLFIEGEREEAIPLALQAAASDGPEAQLEAWFYLAVLGEPQGEAEARREVERLLREGVRSPGWDFSGILAQVRRHNRGDVAWAEETADRISSPVAPRVSA